MIEGSLSRRYAKALFELAREARQEEVIDNELERFLGIYDGSELRIVLSNPAFELESRKKILAELTARLQLSGITAHFLSLLLEHDRLAYLPFIISRYHRMLDEARGRVEANVSAPVPLETSVLARLREALGRVSGKEVILKQQTDPSLIGGVVVELEGTVYDGSVRTQLEYLKQRFVRG